MRAANWRARVMAGVLAFSQALPPAFAAEWLRPAPMDRAPEAQAGLDVTLLSRGGYRAFQVRIGRANLASHGRFLASQGQEILLWPASSEPASSPDGFDRLRRVVAATMAAQPNALPADYRLVILRDPLRGLEADQAELFRPGARYALIAHGHATHTVYLPMTLAQAAALLDEAQGEEALAWLLDTSIRSTVADEEISVPPSDGRDVWGLLQHAAARARQPRSIRFAMALPAPVPTE